MEYEQISDLHFIKAECVGENFSKRGRYRAGETQSKE